MTEYIDDSPDPSDEVDELLDDEILIPDDEILVLDDEIPDVEAPRDFLDESTDDDFGSMFNH
jgi:hypothetical protein